MNRSFLLATAAAVCIRTLVFSVALQAAEAVKERPAAPEIPPKVESTVKLPEVTEKGVIRTLESFGHSVRLNVTEQVLHLDAPKLDDVRAPGDLRPGDTVKVVRNTKLIRGRDAVTDLRSAQLLPVIERKESWLRTVAAGQSGWVSMKDVELRSTEPAIRPTLREATDNRTVSYGVIAQKCKQFDDGLYAAVELAAQQGAGQFAGKKRLLGELAKAVLADAAVADNQAGALVLAASGYAKVQPPLPSTIKRRVDAVLSEFQGNPLLSKPIGFYTWSSDLRSIFQQDRLLQTEIDPGRGTQVIVSELEKHPEMSETYDRYLQLVSRLTNPLNAPDLRSLEGASADQPAKVRFFPPSIAHETELVKRLYSDRPIPDDFDLAKELVAQVQAGKIDLTPKDNSGWYDYQTWSLEPLILPDTTPEAKHLEFGEEYRRLLVELFKGVLALTRETHIKQLENPPEASAVPPPKEKIKLFIAPEVSVEPLATAYLRRAIAYQFVRQVLVDALGEAALAKMHRLTAAGPVETTLDKELDSIEALLHGAYVTASRQIGMPGDDEMAKQQRDGVADAGEYLDWAANLGRDTDVGQDARMMVPVFYDMQRKKTKVLVFLGWAPKAVSISFAKEPKVQEIRDKADKPVADEDVEVHFVGDYGELMYPVVAEVYVTKLLDRDEFGRHCDLYKTRMQFLQS